MNEYSSLFSEDFFFSREKVFKKEEKSVACFPALETPLLKLRGKTLYSRQTKYLPKAKESIP